MKVSPDDVVAFRLHAHHLTERLGRDGLRDAAGACGVQNSPPGSTLLALHARMRGLTKDGLDEAVAGDKSLLQSWCMRGAPFHFPTADAHVFTTGVLPPTEAGMRRLVVGATPSLDALGLSLRAAVELARAEIGDVLAGRRLAVQELGAEVAERVAPRLPKDQRDLWEAEGPYAPGQPLGEALVHFCLRILTLQRVVCFGPREGNKAPFVLYDEWLPDPGPDTETDPEPARAELLRRYLHCYGPSTRADFAAWLGVRTDDVDPWWNPLQEELTQVEAGRAAWLLTEDLETLRSAPAPEGVRLLPPHDPYTQLRDRDTIVDPGHHRAVWKTSGDPGTVLADGRIVGTWRARRSGRRLTIAVGSFGSLPARSRRALDAEAEQVATLRGASSVTVELDG